MKVIYVIILILVLIGGLSRGAVWFFDINVIAWLANIAHPAIVDPETAELLTNPLVKKCTTIAYDVIGVATVALLGLKIFGCKKCCKR